MLDWAEDEELSNTNEPRTFMGFGQRAANSLSPLQQWHVRSFARSSGRAKLIGIHAPPLGPFSNWTDKELRRGEKTYKPGKDSRQRLPDGRGRRDVDRHTIFAIRPKDAPFGVEALQGSIVRHRDWFIREVEGSASGVRIVLSGHIHRFGLLVAHPHANDRAVRLMKSVTLDEVRGAKAGMAAVRREAGQLRAFPSPLYVNTTSAGPRGNEYGDEWRGLAPGWTLVTLGADGTRVRVAVAARTPGGHQAPSFPGAETGAGTGRALTRRTGVARFLQRPRA